MQGFHCTSQLDTPRECPAHSTPLALCPGNAEAGCSLRWKQDGDAWQELSAAAHKLKPHITSSRRTLGHQHQRAMEHIHACWAALLAHVDARVEIKSRDAPWHPFWTLPPRALQHRSPPRREDFTLVQSWVLSCLRKKFIKYINKFSLGTKNIRPNVLLS